MPGVGSGRPESRRSNKMERDEKMNRWTGDSGYGRLDRRTFGIAVAAAYGVGLWTHLVHWRSGAREAHDVTFWAHWMRDSTLSIPLVLLAVLAATKVARRRSGAPRLVVADPPPTALRPPL